MAIGTGLGAIIGGGLNAAASFIGAGKNRRHQSAMADKTFQQNQQMARYQHSKDVEQWNRSNRYNSPSEQMKRLKEANLNPNLVWSKGGVSNQSSSQLPKYNSPTADYTGVSSGSEGITGAAQSLAGTLSTYLDLKTKAAGADKLSAEAEQAEIIAGLDKKYRPEERRMSYRGKYMTDKRETDWQKAIEGGIPNLESNRIKLDNLLEGLKQNKSQSTIKGKEADFWDTGKFGGLILRLLGR